MIDENADEYQADFFVDGKMDIRKLRHDLGGALTVVFQMAESMQHDSQKNAARCVLLKKALERLAVIHSALKDESSRAHGAQSDLVDVVFADNKSSGGQSA